jgi:hypothetical protein
MSSKIDASQYKARISALNKLGLKVAIKPTKANPLTKAQKEKVNKLWRTWNEQANNPKDFEKINVGKLSTDDKKKLEKSGYKILGSQAIIPKQGYGKATIVKEWGKDKDGNPIKILQVKRSQKLNGETRKVQTEYIGSNAEKMTWRDRLIFEYEMGKFKDGETVGLKVFDNSPMANSERLDVKSIIKYAENIQWKIPHLGKGTMLDNIHLVKTWVKGGNEADLLKDSRTQSREKRQRAKNRSLTGTKKRKPNNKRGK